MADRLTVHRDGKEIYDIVMETSFDRLGEEVSRLAVAGSRLCIVSDDHVAPLYLEAVREQLEPCCRQVDAFRFPEGEAQKNLDTVRNLYTYLIGKQYDRNDVLVALGGGVVGDLCGFAAATYLRGIRFIQIPTTLLSQVDSSIGGKTGVDFDTYKNMVGAFHMPSLVYINTAVLKTLPEDQFISGMGEVIKHGLIRDQAYYRWIQEHEEGICSRDLSVCEKLILDSARIKRDVVEQDPLEKGNRALLNFGHTLGHAVEKLMDFQMLHGQCVAMGCAGAAYISFRRGLLSSGDLEDILGTLRRFGLLVSLAWTTGLDAQAVVETTRNDKKMDSGKIRFVLLQEIGSGFVDRTVTEEEMAEAVRWMLGEPDRLPEGLDEG